MSARARSPRPARAGFTLIELAISLAIFCAAGYVATVALRAADRSEREVQRIARASRGLRSATSRLAAELQDSRDASIAISTLADGNHELRFQMPIDDAGALGWGVYDRMLGSTAELQNRPGWQLCYTVLSSADAGGAIERRLVRQIRDDADALQLETVLTRGLCAGGSPTPGFHVEKSGELWELQIFREDSGGAGQQAGAILHVRTRNE